MSRYPKLYCPRCGGSLKGSWGLYSTQGKPCWDCAQKEFAAEQRARVAESRVKELDKKEEKL